MPTYVYKCPGCGYTFEVKHSIKDYVFGVCTKCGTRAHVVIQPPAIHFKGNGFYETDYKKKG